MEQHFQLHRDQLRTPKRSTLIARSARRYAKRDGRREAIVESGDTGRVAELKALA